MAMMASATAGNPYETYNNTEIEQDLIDPDDGRFNHAGPERFAKASPTSEHQ